MNKQDDSRQSGQDGAQQQQVDPQRPWESGRQGGGSNYGHASRGPEQEKSEPAGQDQPGPPSDQGSHRGSGSNLALSLAGSGNGALPAGSGRSDSDPSDSDDSPSKARNRPNQ